MSAKIVFVALCVLSSLPNAAMAQTSPSVQARLDLVDPFIGTGPDGHTFPGATVPFGMVQLSPDTQIRPFKQSYKLQVGIRIHNEVNGICGNDDVGQMSAWYVLSAMGFYPVCPGEGIYILGSPLFPRVRLHLDKTWYKGASFAITAQNQAPNHPYVQSAKLNGEPLSRAWLRHSEIVAGGTLEFVMGAAPNNSGRRRAGICRLPSLFRESDVKSTARREHGDVDDDRDGRAAATQKCPGVARIGCLAGQLVSS